MVEVKLDISNNVYGSLYQKYGVDERSLGWTKNKQDIRFEQLLRYIEDKKKMSILDVGCGFGDLYQYIKDYRNVPEVEYYGIDILESFVEVAKQNHEDIKEKIQCCALSDLSPEPSYDWVVECGIFAVNVAGTEEDMYSYIAETMKKAFEMSKEGISFYFLSDKVDYKTPNSFHARPEKILEMAYQLSRRVILDNSVMPFEYCITIWKNDKFAVETTVYDSYYQKNS